MSKQEKIRGKILDAFDSTPGEQAIAWLCQLADVFYEEGRAEGHETAIKAAAEVCEKRAERWFEDVLRGGHPDATVMEFIYAYRAILALLDTEGGGDE